MEKNRNLRQPISNPVSTKYIVERNGSIYPVQISDKGEIHSPAPYDYMLIHDKKLYVGYRCDPVGGLDIVDEFTLWDKLIDVACHVNDCNYGMSRIESIFEPSGEEYFVAVNIVKNIFSKIGDESIKFFLENDGKILFYPDKPVTELSEHELILRKARADTIDDYAKNHPFVRNEQFDNSIEDLLLIAVKYNAGALLPEIKRDIVK